MNTNFFSRMNVSLLLSCLLLLGGCTSSIDSSNKEGEAITQLNSSTKEKRSSAIDVRVEKNKLIITNNSDGTINFLQSSTEFYVKSKTGEWILSQNTRTAMSFSQRLMSQEVTEYDFSNIFKPNKDDEVKIIIFYQTEANSEKTLEKTLFYKNK